MQRKFRDIYPFFYVLHAQLLEICIYKIKKNFLLPVMGVYWNCIAQGHLKMFAQRYCSRYIEDDHRPRGKRLPKVG